jgi:CheY-like chemotaxis protein
MARVLIVDDDLEICEVLKAFVEHEGHEVLIAADGQQARSELQKHPDLMLLDVDMPGETGVELVLNMRRGEIVPEVQIVFVTAYCERCAPLQATGKGACAVLLKPFRLYEVGRVLQDALARNRSN